MKFTLVPSLNCSTRLPEPKLKWGSGEGFSFARTRLWEENLNVAEVVKSQALEEALLRLKVGRHLEGLSLLIS